MSLTAERGSAADEFQLVPFPAHGDVRGPALLRRSARPSRRALLVLHDLGIAFAPADLARWFNERGFDVYLADLGPDAGTGQPRGRAGRTLQDRFATLDSACQQLTDGGGIDAIVLAAHGTAARGAALWCDARSGARPVQALILSSPVLGRALRGCCLDIACPVLVISADGAAPPDTPRRVPDAARLGQHVTSLHLQADLSGRPAGPDGTRLFDEIGRWLGAYLYGQPRDRLL
jgi:alpha-beta hydrolase superfamily lysophospholipase